MSVVTIMHLGLINLRLTNKMWCHFYIRMCVFAKLSLPHGLIAVVILSALEQELANIVIIPSIFYEVLFICG